MGRVFISYSSRDKQIADAICHILEENGMACWIAPRDIVPGMTWASNITHAISDCALMVLVYSKASNASEQVANEVDRAFSRGKTIVPFMLDPTPMNDDLSYYLSRKHWLEAYPDYRTKLTPLVEAVASNLGITMCGKALPAMTAQPKIVSDERAVDLGLSVKWASCNVGATAPENYGGLYGWADATDTKTSIDFYDYPSSNPPSNICGDSRYDIARAKWGGSWRLPTLAEIKELLDRCKLEWTILQGVKVTGPSGKSILLPAAGCRYGTLVTGRIFNGGYWSGELNTSSTDSAYDLYLYFSGRPGWNLGSRYDGRSVRAVAE